MQVGHRGIRHILSSQSSVQLSAAVPFRGQTAWLTSPGIVNTLDTAFCCVNLVANCTEFDYIVNFVVNILAYSIACARCRQGFRPYGADMRPS
jgi:hypothetical protein